MLAHDERDICNGAAAEMQSFHHGLNNLGALLRMAEKARLARLLHRFCPGLCDVMEEAGELGQGSAVDSAGYLFIKVSGYFVTPRHLIEERVVRSNPGIKQAVHESHCFDKVIEHVPVVFFGLRDVAGLIQFREDVAKDFKVIK